MSSHKAFPPGFTFVKELGRGGTAMVVQASTLSDKRDIALKLPLETQDTPDISFENLAQRERRIIGGLRYPGLVRIHNVSLETFPYVAMELCNGITLDKVGRIESLSLALNVISAIAINLEFLKLKGIIHGDIKPHNIFLPSDWQTSLADGTAFVKLFDFSLGRLTDEPETDRAGLGTVGYMAPETIKYKSTSIRSDLFALGVIAYQVLTGEHPFITETADPVEINSRCCEEAPVPIEKLRPDLNIEIINLVNRMLAKDKIERPESGWEICQLLKQAGADYPFQRKLRAAYLANNEVSINDIVNNWLVLDDKQRRRFDFLTNQSANNIRLLLSDNQRRGNLIYNGQRFEFYRNIYWPAWMRRRCLIRFSDSPLTIRKQLVKTAIIGSVKDYRKLDFQDSDNLEPSDELTVRLLRQFLSMASFWRFSQFYATIADSKEEHELAARLYIQAGDFENAEQTAFQAAISFRGNHSNDKALILLKQVISYGNLINRQSDTRQLLMLKGDILKETGETEEALSAYKTILNLYKNIPPDKLLGETYKDIGDLYKTLQKFEQGLYALNQALTIYKSFGNELEVSRTLNNIGNIYWVRSELQLALGNYRAALKIQRKLRAETEIASTLSNIGSIYAIQGRLNRAIHIMLLSLELKKKLGNEGEIARSLNNLGYCYHISGQHTRAVDCLAESLQLNRRIGNKKEILYNLENLTALMITAGQLKESLGYLKEGMALADDVGDKPHIAVFHLSIATVLRRMGQLGEAEKSLSVVENTIADIDDEILSVQLLTSRAAIRAAIGDTECAIEQARNALERARQVNAKPEELNALLVLTKVSSDSQIFEDAMNLSSELSMERESSLAMFNHLNRLIADGAEELIDSLVEKALPRLESITDDIELANICNTAAEYYLREGLFVEAERMISRAMKSATVSNLIFERIQTLMLMGKLQMTRGNFELCFDNLKTALQLSRKVADNLPNKDDRRIFQNQRSIQSLVSEIKNLNQRIAKRELTT
ncbi:MAG: tetratricopeptide repeat protein [candidate division Zixibacteria bacterium]|nr:tetratricopeptide repeat protein [candidate division Zixibacteria bacterium]